MAKRHSSSFSWKKKTSKPEPKEPPKEIIKEDKGLALAMKIIDKEHELDKNCNSIVIQELIDIYSEAIEYYSQINDNKYLDLQSRMHRIIVRPDVIQALRLAANNGKTEERPAEYMEKNKAVNGSPDKEDEEKVVIEDCIEIDLGDNEGSGEVKEPEIVEEFNDRLVDTANADKGRARRSRSFDGEIDLQKLDAELEFDAGEKGQNRLAPPREYVRRHNSGFFKSQLGENSLYKQNSSTSGKALNIIIDRHAKTNKTTATRAAADFKSQDSALERRLATRQKVKLTQSMSFSSCNSSEMKEAFKCDLSAVFEEEDFSTKSSCFIIEEQADETEKYEKMLEIIMEQNFSQRAAKIAEIKVKYEMQINEIAGMGDSMKILVDQMKSNMEDEIYSVIQEYDNKRKAEIAAVKAVM